MLNEAPPYIKLAYNKENSISIIKKKNEIEFPSKRSSSGTKYRSSDHYFKHFNDLVKTTTTQRNYNFDIKNNCKIG